MTSPTFGSRRFEFPRCITWGLVFILLAAPASGCARYQPKFGGDTPYLQRMKTQTRDSVTISVAGLSAAESRKIFGVDLAKHNILPVWLKIENHDPQSSYFFLQRGLDPNYFSAGEAAYIARIRPGIRLFDRPLLRILMPLGFFLAPVDYFFVQPANDRMREAFTREAIKYGWFAPGEAKAGFVFVPFEMGTKQVTVDLIEHNPQKGSEVLKRFDFFVEIPGINADYRNKAFDDLYKPEEIRHIAGEAEFQKALEELPCCVTDFRGKKKGDPLNLVVIATLPEILEAFTTAEWDETETISFRSILRMIRSFSLKKAYNYSPISPLYLYGRSQDIALQKTRGNIHERMHLRLWLSPMTFDGKPVWIGQASRDIGIRFTARTWNLMTHKIDPDVDESALYVLSDLVYRRRVGKYGVVGGGIPRTPENPGRNLTGDPYYTSGKRMVMELPAKQAPEVPARFFVPGEQ